MEYLVTMTTSVPVGTTEQEISDIRAREGIRTRELTLEGRVRRLWRPPLQPGEWRTIGLFAADDAADLEQTLASMPLRVWRSDDVVALGRHPNDPGYQHTAIDLNSTEFLTTLVLATPPGTSSAALDTMKARDAERTHQLADGGQLVRLWILPGHGRSLGHWQARDSSALKAALQSQPMADWLSVEIVPLSRHPSDPATLEQGSTSTSTSPLASPAARS